MENSFSIAMQRGPRSGEARSTRSSEGQREARPWRLASGEAESREWRWRQMITVAPESSGLTTARYRWQLYLSTPGLSYWTETEGGGRLAYTAPFTSRASGGRQSITPTMVPGPSSSSSSSLLKGPAPHSPALTYYQASSPHSPSTEPSRSGNVCLYIHPPTGPSHSSCEVAGMASHWRGEGPEVQNGQVTCLQADRESWLGLFLYSLPLLRLPSSS